jgi:hypothetical protein
MLTPLSQLAPPRVIGGPDRDPTPRCPEGKYEVRPAWNASRSESHLNQTIPANRSQTMPMNSITTMSRGFSIRATPSGPNPNATNARINTIAVATILPTTVNLPRKTVRFTTLEI